MSPLSSWSNLEGENPFSKPLFSIGASESFTGSFFFQKLSRNFQTQEIITALATATVAELLEIRTRLKASIRRLIVRIDCEFLDLGKMKCCKMLVTFANGEEKAWQITTNKRATHTWVHGKDCEFESLKIKVG